MPLHYHFTAMSLPLPYRIITASLPLHYRFTDTSLPLRCCFITTFLSLHYRFTGTFMPLHCHFYAASLPLYCNFTATSTILTISVIHPLAMLRVLLFFFEIENILIFGFHEFFQRLVHDFGIL